MKLGIISDIHEDLPRLEAAFHLLDQLGCQEVACLGDIIGYTVPSFGFFHERNASACIQLVKKNCRYVVAGNHDLSATKKIPEHKAGFKYPEDWYAMDFREKEALAGGLVWLNEEVEMDPLLSAEEINFIHSLPEYQVVKTNTGSILLSHYLYPDLSGSSIVHYNDFGPVNHHFDFMEKQGCRLGFSGHQHVEGYFRITRFHRKLYNFGKQQLDAELQWIVGPCIANGKRDNGCLVFNTETNRLRAIPLNTPPRVMITVPYNKLENAD